MSSLLYFPIHEKLTTEDILKIDQQVIRNRKGTYKVVKNLSLKSSSKAKFLCQKLKTIGGKAKIKVKRFGAHVMLIYTLTSPFQIILPIPSAPIQIEKVRETKQSQFFGDWTPQVANLLEKRSDKIVLSKLTAEQMKEIEMLALQVYNGSITMDQAILKLKGGMDITALAVVATIAYMVYLITSNLTPADAFVLKPTFLDDPVGYFNYQMSKSKPFNNNQYTSRRVSQFDRDVVGAATQMSMANSDQDGFIMSREEALKLLTETYPGEIQINEDCRMTEWQAASHLYHGMGLGIEPPKYGITQDELMKITNQEGGFIKYVQRGNKLPTIEHVRAYQEAVKNICLDSETEQRNDIEFFDVNGKKLVTTFKNGQFIMVFNQATGDPVTNQDFITGDKRNRSFIKKFDKTGQLGAQKWIKKWSSNNN